MTIDIHKRSEGVHYQMIPGVDDTEQAWNIRILEGKFSETVIEFSNIQVGPGPADSVRKEDQLYFNFKVVSSPDPELTPDDVDLQNECGSLLMAVIEDAIKDKAIQIGDHNLVEDVKINQTEGS
jgi:hypothetical protein|tara:strand:- start:3461 stop:3832 length:372 start_codon:yes stop_codon:yes gene_type:complete